MKIGVNEGDISEIQDGSGNVYELVKELGRGVAGAVYKATVKASKNGQFELGNEVAIKVHKPPTSRDMKRDQEREIKVLQREGTSLANNILETQEGKQQVTVHPLFPGIDFRSAIYQIGEDANGVPLITGKEEMTPIQKDKLAASLLNDYAALQQLGIVHCDIKPDNILYDKESGTAKIIDMGEAFFQIEGTPYDRLQGPGGMYMGPEVDKQNEQEVFSVNTPQTDMYGLAMIIASIYSDNVYEKEAGDLSIDFRDNAPLKYREILSDILGDGVRHKEGMPDELLKIVQHMASTDLVSRPTNIALANGASEYYGTREICESQKRTEEFIKDFVSKESQIILKSSKLSKNFKEAYQSKFGKEGESIKDLTNIRIALKELFKDFSNEKHLERKLNNLVSGIDSFSREEAAKIQVLRTIKIQESNFIAMKKEILSNLNAVVDENKKVIPSSNRDKKEVQLETAANVNKRIVPASGNVKNMSRQTSMTFFYNAKIGPNSGNYNDIGKIFLSASRGISGSNNTKHISEILSTLVKKIYENKEIDPEKRGELSSNIIAHIDKFNKYVGPANVEQEKPNRSRLRK